MLGSRNEDFGRVGLVWPLVAISAPHSAMKNKKDMIGDLLASMIDILSDINLAPVQAVQ